MMPSQGDAHAGLLKRFGAIDAMAAAVPGLDRDTLLATMPQILDLW